MQNEELKNDRESSRSAEGTEEVKNDERQETSPEDESLSENEAELSAETSKNEQAREQEDYKNKFLYLAAEMENIKRRNQREKENLLKYGNENLLKEVLEVVDNFERTIQALQGDEDKKVKNIVLGVEMIQKQLAGVLSKFGLSPVETEGQIFDPNFHEAVGQESVNEKEDDAILREFQKGYTLNGRLLRASKVVVNKKEQ